MSETDTTTTEGSWPAEAGRDASPPEPWLMRYGFEAGSIGVLFDPAQVTQVAELEGCCPLPNSAPWFLGLVNVQGTLVPVYDLARACGTAMASAVRGQRKLLVIGQGARAAGIVIDGLPRRIPVHPLARGEGGVFPVPIAGHVIKAYRGAGREWLALDFHALFHELCEAASL